MRPSVGELVHATYRPNLEPTVPFLLTRIQVQYPSPFDAGVFGQL
jgi:hypothetical protein